MGALFHKSRKFISLSTITIQKCTSLDLFSMQGLDCHAMLQSSISRRRFEYLGSDSNFLMTKNIFVKMSLENVMMKPHIRNALLIYRVITLNQGQLH